MNILIVYTTRYGSVKTCMEKLRPQLHGDVTVVPLQERSAPALETFDAIILGGSIYIGKTQKALQQFARQHLDTLLQKPVFLFLCCHSQEEDHFQANFPAKLYDHAALKSYFGGELTISKLSFFHRLLAKLMKATDYSDIHDDTIKDFAEAVNALNSQS